MNIFYMINMNIRLLTVLYLYTISGIILQNIICNKVDCVVTDTSVIQYYNHKNLKLTCDLFTNPVPDCYETYNKSCCINGTLYYKYVEYTKHNHTILANGKQYSYLGYIDTEYLFTCCVTDDNVQILYNPLFEITLTSIILIIVYLF